MRKRLIRSGLNGYSKGILNGQEQDKKQRCQEEVVAVIKKNGKRKMLKK